MSRQQSIWDGIERPVLAAMVLCALVRLAQPAPAADPSSGQSVYTGLPYRVVDGWAVYDGDILLGPVVEVERRSRRPKGSRKGPLIANDAAVPISPGFRTWPDGIIPFVIDTNLRPEAGAAFLAAVDHWNERTVIRLRPRTNEKDYVRVEAGPSTLCGADVGHSPGESSILTPNDENHCSVDEFIHEIGHIVGLWHEHQRQDRDENRLVDRRYDFWGFAGDSGRSEPTRNFGPYDYRSAMSYQRESNETIPPGIPLFGDVLSDGDIDGVARLYGKVPAATTIATNPPGLEVVVDGIAHTAPARFTWSPGTTHTLEIRTGAQSLPGDSNGRWLFGRWADHSPRTRTVTATPERTWYEANFIEQRQPNVDVYPPAAGTLAFEPAPPGGWYTLRSTMHATAHPTPETNWRLLDLCCGSGIRFRQRNTSVARSFEWSAEFTTEPVFALRASAEIFAKSTAKRSSYRKRFRRLNPEPLRFGSKRPTSLGSMTTFPASASNAGATGRRTLPARSSCQPKAAA